MEEVGVLLAITVVEVNLIQKLQACQMTCNPSGATLDLREGYALEALEGAQNLPVAHRIGEPAADPGLLGCTVRAHSKFAGHHHMGNEPCRESPQKNDVAVTVPLNSQGLTLRY